MVTAQVAWELADATEGRFVLGLGTQVRAHIERRYSSAYERPGPRLRDYIQSVRAIWRAFQGDEKLDYRGEFYNFTMLGDTWTGGPIAHPDIPIYAAAVRPWMLRMCGEVADGVHVHPFHSRRYLDDVVRTSVDEGAQRAGRRPEAITLAVPIMSIVGDDNDELDRWRERARMQIAFYGSTRTHRGIFEVARLGHKPPSASTRVNAAVTLPRCGPPSPTRCWRCTRSSRRGVSWPMRSSTATTGRPTGSSCTSRERASAPTLRSSIDGHP